MSGYGHADRDRADWGTPAAADCARPCARCRGRGQCGGPRAGGPGRRGLMARPVPGGPPPPPTVQRLTIRYAKRGRMRFASHRDVARAMERGVRKAGIPVAYSAGFSPHPRISYSGGAPTGSASEAEYLEVAVTRRCEPDDVGRRLDAALPDGIDVIEVVEAQGTAGGLRFEAAAWEVAWPGVAPDAAAAAVRALLDAPTAEVRRLTSKGTRILDARAAVISLACETGI